MFLRYYVLVLFIITGNIFGGLATSVTTKSWLLTSGISYFTNLPYFVCILPVFVFAISLVLIIVYMATKKQFLYYSNLVISLFISLVEVYFAFNWILNTNSFFLKLYPTFELMINTPEIVPMESNMKCCGFRNLKDFKDDLCLIQAGTQVRHPCYLEMCKRYSLSLSGSGVFLLAHFISHISVCLIFRQIYLMNGKAQGYGMLPSADFSDVDDE